MRLVALFVLLIVTLMLPRTLSAQQNDGFRFPAHDLQSTPVDSNEPTRAAYVKPNGLAYEQANHVQQANFAQQTTQQTTQPIAAHEASFPMLTPSSESATETSSSQSLGPLMTTVFSLAIVLGLFAGLVWVSRRFGNPAMAQGTLPSDALQSLGSTAIDAKTRVTMMRCGKRIIVLAQTATGVHPLSEITDPAEVQRLTAACLGRPDTQPTITQPTVPQPTFAQTLQQVDAQPKRRGLFTT